MKKPEPRSATRADGVFPAGRGAAGRILQAGGAAEALEKLFHVLNAAHILGGDDVDTDDGWFDFFDQVCEAQGRAWGRLDGDRLSAGFRREVSEPRPRLP